MNYFIEYKYLTDLVLDEVVEIHHSAKFIDRILISTGFRDISIETNAQHKHLNNILKIKFEVSNEINHCRENEIEGFFASTYCPYSLEREKNSSNYELLFLNSKREIALKKTEEIVENIYDVLYFNEREFHKYNQVDTNIPKVIEVFVCPPITLNMYFGCGKMISGSEELKINATVKESIKLIEQNNSYYRTLRMIKENKEIDNISKYMILYSLLAEICESQSSLGDPIGNRNGQQARIDRFLLQLNPARKLVPSTNTNKSGKLPPDETEITFWRNQIGHSKGTKLDLKQLQSNINIHLDDLFFTLKQAITRFVL